jgi:uncharacterized protein YecT (DUF1311 family)
MRSHAFLPASLLTVALAIAFAPRACADIIVNIDKNTQSLTVTVDGALRYIWPVSTGKPGYDTPNGTFRPNRMDADHFSQEWGNAPMPHTIFFDLHGHAIHGFFGASRIGSAASHGCVRLSAEHAATLFYLVKARGMKETTVVISGRTPAGVGPEVARSRAPVETAAYPMHIAVRNVEQPAPHAQEPAAIGEHPTADGQKAEASAQQPDTNGDQLAVDRQQADAYAQQPGANGQQAEAYVSAANGEQPAPHAQQLAANGEQPAANGQQAEASARQAAAMGEQAAADGQQAEAYVSPTNGEQPAPHAQQLAANGKQPAANGQQVEASARQPAAIEQPAAKAQQVEAYAQQPAAIGEQPAANGQQAEAYVSPADGEQPAPHAQRPAAIGEQLGAKGQQTEAYSQQPAATGEQPAADGQPAEAYAQQAAANGKQPEPSPSFDCAKETGAVERAVCGDQDLSRLDADMDHDFKVALEWLSVADAAALRADQRAWLATRPALLAISALKAGMEERVAIFKGTILNTFPLLGEWVNHATSILIQDRHGLIVNFRNEHCSNLGSAYYAGDTGTIGVRTGGDGNTAENWSLRISRRGPLLMVEEVPPSRRGKAEPQRPCSEGSGVVGIYFQKSRDLPLPSLGHADELME